MKILVAQNPEFAQTCASMTRWPRISRIGESIRLAGTIAMVFGIRSSP